MPLAAQVATVIKITVIWWYGCVHSAV